MFSESIYVLHVSSDKNWDSWVLMFQIPSETVLGFYILVGFNLQPAF